MKNPLTQAGIEPATFRFVAQHLNHCATAVPNARVCVCVCVCVYIYIYIFIYLYIEVVHFMHFVDQCIWFIAPTKCVVLFIYKY